MDPKDQEIERLKNELAAKDKTIAEKDVLIEQKTKDVVGARRKYKLLNEMTDEEKAALTDEEKARREETDEIVAQQEALAKQQADDKAKEVAERRANIAKRLAGADVEAQKKILENFDKIKGADLALTESEIEPFMNTALNMLGDAKPAPIRQVVNANNAIAPITGENNAAGFAETDQGKSVAAGLGLGFTSEAAAADQK